MQAASIWVLHISVQAHDWTVKHRWHVMRQKRKATQRKRGQTYVIFCVKGREPVNGRERGGVMRTTDRCLGQKAWFATPSTRRSPRCLRHRRQKAYKGPIKPAEASRTGNTGNMVVLIFAKQHCSMNEGQRNFVVEQGRYASLFLRQDAKTENQEQAKTRKKRREGEGRQN